MNATKRDLMLIRLAIHDARDAIEHFRATGETHRHTPPLPQRRNVRIYSSTYKRALRSYS